MTDEVVSTDVSLTFSPDTFQKALEYCKFIKSDLDAFASECVKHYLEFHANDTMDIVDLLRKTNKEHSDVIRS